MRTRGGDSHLHTQERPQEGSALPRPALGRPASSPGENGCVLFSPASLELC